MAVEADELLQSHALRCLVILGQHPCQMLENNRIAGESEGSLMIEPKFLFGLLQQCLKHGIIQVSRWDYEPFKFLPHINGQISGGNILGTVITTSRDLSFQVPITDAINGRKSFLVGTGEILPFLHYLSQAHDLADLVSLNVSVHFESARRIYSGRFFESPSL